MKKITLTAARSLIATGNAFCCQHPAWRYDHHAKRCQAARRSTITTASSIGTCFAEEHGTWSYDHASLTTWLRLPRAALPASRRTCSTACKPGCPLCRRQNHFRAYRESVNPVALPCTYSADDGPGYQAKGPSPAASIRLSRALVFAPVLCECSYTEPAGSRSNSAGCDEALQLLPGLLCPQFHGTVAPSPPGTRPRCANTCPASPSSLRPDPQTGPGVGVFDYVLAHSA